MLSRLVVVDDCVHQVFGGLRRRLPGMATPGCRKLKAPLNDGALEVQDARQSRRPKAVATQQEPPRGRNLHLRFFIHFSSYLLCYKSDKDMENFEEPEIDPNDPMAYFNSIWSMPFKPNLLNTTVFHYIMIIISNLKNKLSK